MGIIFSQFNMIGCWKMEVSERSPFACPARELQMFVRLRKSEFAGQTLILSAHIGLASADYVRGRIERSGRTTTNKKPPVLLFNFKLLDSCAQGQSLICPMTHDAL